MLFRSLRDLLKHSVHLTFDDLNLLRVGRHFRLDNNTKVIVGRDEKENNQLEAYKKPHYGHVEALGIGSPVCLVIGDCSDDNLKKAAMITARFTSAKKNPTVEITLVSKESQPTIVVSPAKDEDLQYIQIK